MQTTLDSCSFLFITKFRHLLLHFLSLFNNFLGNLLFLCFPFNPFHYSPSIRNIFFSHSHSLFDQACRHFGLWWHPDSQSVFVRRLGQRGLNHGSSPLSVIYKDISNRIECVKTRKFSLALLASPIAKSCWSPWANWALNTVWKC